MCGICGEFRFDGQFPKSERIDKMLHQLRPRGPDDEGHYALGPVALGHRRLSIIDLSHKSHQPMVDISTGLSIVFNGTIYNYPELREQLIGLGHHFNSQGDTEVILKAYAQWGEFCVERFNGMFAFAIWNQRDETLFAARDRMGIKPFYFSQTQQRFLFASNTQALLATGNVDTGLDSAALHNMYSLHAVVPAPRTILKGVRKLAPAHCITINRLGQVQQRRYWSLSARRPAEQYDAVEWREKIHQALKKSVQRRLEIADVPVGVLLSGGLDSSLLVALLAEQGVTDLRTFTIGFEDQPEERGSEFEFSDPVAELYQTQHHKFVIENSEVLKRMPEAVDAMAEPMFAQDAVAFYLLSEQVSKEIKVVQSGQGADEVFGGYFWYEKMQQATGTPLERFAPFYFDREHSEYEEMVQPAYQVGDVTSELIGDLLRDVDADQHIDAVLALDTTTLIVDDPVKRVDNMTMAWGLEARVPFLDHELVEVAASMPPEHKLSQGGKGVLKDLSRELLPAAVIDRPKGYFPMPALKYVRGEFLEFITDVLGSQKAKERGIFQPAYVEKLMRDPNNYHTRIQGNKLWHLALLEYWLQRHGV